MLRKVRDLEETKEVAQRWQSVFTGVSPICNRITPDHRDLKGRPEWFDLLASYSAAGSSPQLLIKDIGLTLRYSTGTVVGFCGSVLEHAVEEWGDGDRICYAHFLRESVRKRLEVSPAGWVYRSKYLPQVDKKVNKEVIDIADDPMLSDEDQMEMD